MAKKCRFVDAITRFGDGAGYEVRSLNAIKNARLLASWSSSGSVGIFLTVLFVHDPASWQIGYLLIILGIITVTQGLFYRFALKISNCGKKLVAYLIEFVICGFGGLFLACLGYRLLSTSDKAFVFTKGSSIPIVALEVWTLMLVMVLLYWIIFKFSESILKDAETMLKQRESR